MASSFTCTNCNAQYKVVQVEGTPTSDNSELTCVSCDAPLPAYEVVAALAQACGKLRCSGSPASCTNVDAMAAASFREFKVDSPAWRLEFFQLQKLKAHDPVRKQILFQVLRSSHMS